MQHVQHSRDPRTYQGFVLALLLVYGRAWLDFDIPGWHIAAILGTALLTQAVCNRLGHVPTYDPRSACISGLSLCLLLRTNTLLYVVLAALLAIGSKFVLRWRGKHVFNPTNLALVGMLAVTDQVWVSPGQWGSTAWLAFLVACLGGMVVYRAARSDVTCAFLICYVVLRVGRALWLGDPLSIPLHQLQNGALILFAFFMISDPRTTPDSRAGRLVFAGLVASVATFLQFGLYWKNALLWSLAASACLVPVLDRLLPGPRYVWPQGEEGEPRSHKGESYGLAGQVHHTPHRSHPVRS